MSMYSYFMFIYLLRASWHSSTTMTEVFPCFFLSRKANARVKNTAEMGQGPHSSKIFVFYVLCRYVYCLCVNVYCTTATGWLPNWSEQIRVYQIMFRQYCGNLHVRYYASKGQRQEMDNKYQVSHFGLAIWLLLNAHSLVFFFNRCWFVDYDVYWFIYSLSPMTLSVTQRRMTEWKWCGRKRS